MDNHHLSFEFFPPKTEEGKLKLAKVHAKLKSLNPEFFSVTYGAGGSTKNFTKDTVLDIQKKAPTQFLMYLFVQMIRHRYLNF